MPSIPVWEAVVIGLCPLYGWAVFFALNPVVYYFQRKGKADACVRTEDFLSSSAWGLVTYICGIIGAGKTTCASAISNMFSKIKKQQAMAMATKVQGIMSDVDFNEINDVIGMAFFSHHLTNSDAIMNFLLDNDKVLDSKIEGRFYDNRLYPQSYVSLLRDYIDAELALLRDNYVYFNRRKFYCWENDRWAMDYVPSMIDVKDRYESKDYRIQRYSVIFEDEKILSGKSNLNYKEVAEDDGGGDEFFRLIRHLGKGTIHYISTAQDFNRVVKQERELATGVLYIRKRTEMPLMSLEEIFVNIAYDFIARYQIFYLGIAESLRKGKLDRVIERIKRCQSLGLVPFDEDVRAYRTLSDSLSIKESKVRSLLSRLQARMAYFFADSYIQYKGDYYTCADDVGKDPGLTKSAVIKADLVFPLCFAYGSVDTYSFSILNDYLSATSIRSSDFYDPEDHFVPYEGDKDFNDYMQSIIAKRKDQERGMPDRHSDGSGSSDDDGSVGPGEF